MSATNRQCFFVPGKPGIIDEINLATGRSYIEKESLEEIRQRYPGAEIGDLAACARCSEEMFLTEPVAITADKYHEMLNVLPPQRWVQPRNQDTGMYTSTFEMSEHMYGRVTSFFICIERGSEQWYFTYDGYAGTRHAEKVKRCADAFGIVL